MCDICTAAYAGVPVVGFAVRMYRHRLTPVWLWLRGVLRFGRNT